VDRILPPILHWNDELNHSLTPRLLQIKYRAREEAGQGIIFQNRIDSTIDPVTYAESQFWKALKETV
jgi:hypothetical protein